MADGEVQMTNRIVSDTPIFSHISITNTEQVILPLALPIRTAVGSNNANHVTSERNDANITDTNGVSQIDNDDDMQNESDESNIVNLMPSSDDDMEDEKDTELTIPEPITPK